MTHFLRRLPKGARYRITPSKYPSYPAYIRSGLADTFPRLGDPVTVAPFEWLDVKYPYGYAPIATYKF